MEKREADSIVDAAHRVASALEEMARQHGKMTRNLATIADYMPALCEHVGTIRASLDDLQDAFIEWTLEKGKGTDDQAGVE